MGNSGNGASKSALGAQPSCRLPLQLLCAEWAGCPKLGPVGEGTARDAAYMGFGGMRALRGRIGSRVCAFGSVALDRSPTTRRAGAELEFWNEAAELRATQSSYDQPPCTHRRQLPELSGTRTTVQQDSRICCKPPSIARTHRKLAELAGLLERWERRNPVPPLGTYHKREAAARTHSRLGLTRRGRRASGTRRRAHPAQNNGALMSGGWTQLIAGCELASQMAGRTLGLESGRACELERGRPALDVA